MTGERFALARHVLVVHALSSNLRGERRTEALAEASA